MRNFRLTAGIALLFFHPFTIADNYYYTKVLKTPDIGGNRSELGRLVAVSSLTG